MRTCLHRFVFRESAATSLILLLAATIVAGAQAPGQSTNKASTNSGSRDPFEAAADKADVESSKKGGAKADEKEKKKAPPEFIRKTDEQWRKILHPYVFAVTREKMTEPAFSGKFPADRHYRGVFVCACCDAVDVESPLFDAKHKFDSGTGWPSFWRPYSQKSLATAVDVSNPAERRVEVMCRRCGAHLGHVFDDNPAAPTGLRFCINSLAIKLKTPESQDAKTRTSPARSRSRTGTKTKAKNAPKASRNAGKTRTNQSDQPDTAKDAPAGAKPASPRS